MQKSNDNNQAIRAHRQVKSSTTLNRKYVKKPVVRSVSSVTVRRSPSVRHFADQSISAVNVKQAKQEQPIAPATKHPLQDTVNARMQRRTGDVVPAPKLTAKQLKDQAIQKALVNAAKTSKEEAEEKKLKKTSKTYFGFGRVLLALSCAAAAILAIVYFVNLNMPDISLKVAAIQTGIEASYPGYVPRDFNLSGIVSENGKITLNFTNNSTGDAYSITEENSSWDSNALLNNFVKNEYGENYTIIREQGLTIYIDGGNAAWVNGGIVYKLKAVSGMLTKKQISSIAVSL